MRAAIFTTIYFCALPRGGQAPAMTNKVLAVLDVTLVNWGIAWLSLRRAPAEKPFAQSTVRTARRLALAPPHARDMKLIFVD
jgi:hypothetical protein